MVSHNSSNPRKNIISVPEPSLEVPTVVTSVASDESPTEGKKTAKSGTVLSIGKGWKGKRFMRGKSQKKIQASSTIEDESPNAEDSASRDAQSLEAESLDIPEVEDDEDSTESVHCPEGPQEEDPVPESPPPLDLSEWLIVQPRYGTIFPGESTEVSISLEIRHPIELGESRSMEPQDVMLLVRSREACKDQIIIIKLDEYKPSLVGTDVHEFRHLEHSEPLSAMDASDLRAFSPGDSSGVDEFLEQENLQVAMGIGVQCEPTDKLPVPKELWWLFKHINELMNNDLARLISGEAQPEPFKPVTGLYDPTYASCDYNGATSIPLMTQHLMDFFCLPLEQYSARFAQEVQTVKFCVEKGYKIPQSCGAYACLHVLKEWCLSFPSALVCQSHLVSWIECDDMNRHDLCNAFLWALPPYKRNILVLILSLAREIIMHHFSRKEAWIQRWSKAYREKFGRDEADALALGELDSDEAEQICAFGELELTEEERKFAIDGVDLYTPWEEDQTGFKSLVCFFHTKAMADWIVSFVVERANESENVAIKAHQIILHFLKTENFEPLRFFD